MGPSRPLALRVPSTSNPLLHVARPSPTLLTRSAHQTRHATLLRRPRRPYTFTQLITLSDGSTATHRTTSPLAVYTSTRDTRNAPLWNPSDKALVGVEKDEAGRLKAFRRKFGRGWDAAGAGEAEGEQGKAGKGKVVGKAQTADTVVDETRTPPGERAEVVEGLEADSLLDLISSYGQGEQEKSMRSGGGKKKK